MSSEFLEVSGTEQLLELLYGIIDAIGEIADDSHQYLIVDGRIDKLREMAKKLKLEVEHYGEEEE